MQLWQQHPEVQIFEQDCFKILVWHFPLAVELFSAVRRNKAEGVCKHTNTKVFFRCMVSLVIFQLRHNKIKNNGQWAKVQW